MLRKSFSFFGIDFLNSATRMNLLEIMLNKRSLIVLTDQVPLKKW